MFLRNPVSQYPRKNVTKNVKMFTGANFVHNLSMSAQIINHCQFQSRDYIEDLNFKVLLLYDALLNAGNAETSKSINHKVCIPYVQPCFKS